jgi:hypothetical protein
MTVQSKTKLPQHLARTPNGSSDSSSEGLTVQAAYDWVTDTARKNPVLVVGGAVAVGALVVMAVTARKAPQSRVRAFERQLRRDLVSAEKSLRRGVANSGVMSSLADIPSAMASRLSTWDTAQLDALKERAGEIAGEIAARASAVVRAARG